MSRDGSSAKSGERRAEAIRENPGSPPATELAADMLTAVCTRIERGWCQWDDALDKRGRSVDPGSPAACSWSLTGALLVAWDEWRSVGRPAEAISAAFAEAVLAIGASVGELRRWNDAPGRTQEEVLAALDRALSLVRSESEKRP